MTAAIIHTDASVSSKTPSILGLGYTIQSIEGGNDTFCATAVEYKSKQHNPYRAEALAVATAVSEAFRMGYTSVHIFTDNRGLKFSINKYIKGTIKPKQKNKLPDILKSILKKYRKSLKVMWIPREYNCVADRLAYQGRKVYISH